MWPLNRATEAGEYRNSGDGSRPQRACVFYVTLYIALNAHMLRNVSILYLAILAAIEIASLFYIFQYGLQHLRSVVGRWHVIFLLVSFEAALQTIYCYGPTSGAYASVRFYMVVPMVPLSAVIIDSPKRLLLLLKLFIAIVCIGVGSVAVQYATGPIGWFAEPGERGGLMRFGSILGSLPTIGGALPLALFVTLLIPMRSFTKLLAILILVFGVLVSLSKGAVAGTVLAMALFFCMPTPHRRRNIAVVIAVTTVALLAVPFAASNHLLDRTGLYVAALFVQDSADRGGDVTMEASMHERWTSLPRQSLGWLHHTRGDVGWLTGGGFQMLGAALMPDGDSPYFTSHDTYVDLILVAGVPLLLAYIALNAGAIWHLYGSAGRMFFHDAPELRACTIGLMVIIVTAGLFSAGETYQPIIASVWSILIGVAIRAESNRLRDVRLSRIRLLAAAKASQ